MSETSDKAALTVAQTGLSMVPVIGGLFNTVVNFLRSGYQRRIASGYWKLPADQMYYELCIAENERETERQKSLSFEDEQSSRLQYMIKSGSPSPPALASQIGGPSMVLPLVLIGAAVYIARKRK